MTEYVLSLNPGGIDAYPHGIHNPSAVLLADGEIAFGSEEERFTRNKHGIHEFPEQTIRAALDACDIRLGDVDEVVLPWDMSLQRHRLGTDLDRRLSVADDSVDTVNSVVQTIQEQVTSELGATGLVRDRLAEIGTPVPPITTVAHHRAHAASAFYPSGFDSALVVTADGFGEYDATVVWDATGEELDRIRTYEYPNSLGHFYRLVTVYLGYPLHSFSEGKIMGLAPYGRYDEEIFETYRELIDTGADYDVTALTDCKVERGVELIEEAFGHERKSEPTEFDQWERNFAYATQALLEETVTGIVSEYLPEVATNDVALAGGVALNCKMNKHIMEMDETRNVFIQPVAHDAGTTVGAATLASDHPIPEMNDVYWGAETSTSEVISVLETNKIPYTQVDSYRPIAERIADGELVGWFTGRAEMGPRALGHRSILADPRDESSRDRVNKYVKHRETWRPFAPSMLAERADEYLEDYEPSPYMIKTFDTKSAARSEISAVVHPADQTTRPQVVDCETAPAYHELISEFADITGVPVLLNTSFNDSGEPIVNAPRDAIADFYNSGLDALVIEDVLITKHD